MANEKEKTFKEQEKRARELYEEARKNYSQALGCTIIGGILNPFSLFFTVKRLRSMHEHLENVKFLCVTTSVCVTLFEKVDITKNEDKKN